jgi:hypothetical protein
VCACGKCPERTRWLDGCTGDEAGDTSDSNPLAAGATTMQEMKRRRRIDQRAQPLRGPAIIRCVHEKRG